MMALPKTFDKNAVSIARFGVLLAAVPTDSSLFIELERAPDVAGAPGTFEQIVTLAPGQIEHLDNLSPGSGTFWYRARHVGPSVNPSPYTTPVSGTSESQEAGDVTRRVDVAQSEGRRRVDTLRAPGLDGALKAGVGVPDTGTIKVVDAAGAPSSITRPIRFHHAEFLPTTETMTWRLSDISLTPGTVNVTQLFRAPCVVPKGVTLTKVRTRFYRQTTSDLAVVGLAKVANDVATDLATLTHSTTGWTTSEASISQLVGDESYTLDLALKGVAALLDARLQFVEIDYTRPDYGATY